MCKIRVGIVGYGNLGRGVEKNIKCNPDFELVGIFTRRQPETVVLSDKNIKAYKIEDAYNMKEKIDVMILCGGSATDLPEQSPDLAEHFNTVDSFDTHAKIPGFLAKVDAAAKKGGNVSAISIGWDPGMFSLNRLYMSAVLPQGNTYTFWGKGVSQGHSDAVRRIEGVENAIQYTIPVEEVIDEIRAGGGRDYTTREKHKRECFVVAKSGADTAKIENEIKNMPNYFSDYDTTVHFISAEELKLNHSKMPHGGFVIRSGNTGENHHIMEYRLKLDSNPEFTSSVLLSVARAVYRMRQEGMTGAKTIFDIPPVYLSSKSRDELIREML